jgi:uncharacterized protein YchJ
MATLYEQWFGTAYNRDGRINDRLWNDYLPREQKIYEYILSEKVTELKGTVKELAEKFDMNPVYVLGFVDGINDTQEPQIELENMTEETEVDVKIDFEVLYKKMVEYKADHLYSLPQWSNIFTDEQLKSFYKEQKRSTTVVKDHKVGRNDPCPCGSGKKYKHCCGAAK